MKKDKNKRVFSIFRVYDYKGGELSTITNISLDDVVGELVEAGIMDHKEIEYSDDIYRFSDDDIIRICGESEIKDTTYAGGGDEVIRVFEHFKKKRIEEVEIEEFKPYFANYIIRKK